MAGNERVLRGRLDDARFAYRRDLERGLEAMAAATARITYHVRAGSLADRTARLGDLIAQIAAAIGVDPTAALAAARLAKADLGSTLVGEFAELQGQVGAVYARAEGVDEAVAQAIDEHYRPTPPAVRCPRARPAPCSHWPTSSTRSPSRSPSASSRRAPAIPTACAGPRRASSRSHLRATGRSTSGPPSASRTRSPPRRAPNSRGTPTRRPRP